MRAIDLLRRHWWVLPLLAVTVVGTVLRGPNEHYVAAGAWAGVLGAVAVLPLLWRDRWPQVTWLVNAAAVTAYFAVGYPDGPIYLSIFFSAYALCSRWALLRWRPYAWAVVPMVAAIVARRVTHTDAGVYSVVLPTIWFLAVLCAVAAVGYATHNHRDVRREQARRAASEERLRMAQDLHDGVGHGLAVIAMQAGVALHVLDREPERVRESLEAIRDTSRQSLEALRAEIGRLAPTVTDVAARVPRNGIADLPALLDRVRAGGLVVTLEDRSVPVPDPVDGVAYLVVQEALTNVLRHSDGHSARVQLAMEGSVDGGALVVSVADDGQGGPVSEGMGLRGMRARVAAVGGILLVGPGPDGFTVWARMPLRGAPGGSR